jgi:hypothetical protein
MQDNLFFNSKVTPTDVLDQLYQEAAVDSNYYASPAKPPVMRCDVSDNVRQYFKKLIAVPFKDCGFLKIPPNSTYPIHRDYFRITALNMLMVDTNDDFETFMLDISSAGTSKHSVTYVKNEFTILNVMALHGVINKSKDLHRIVLSIGIKEHDYATVLNLHKENKLFNSL